MKNAAHSISQVNFVLIVGLLAYLHGLVDACSSSVILVSIENGFGILDSRAGIFQLKALDLRRCVLACNKIAECESATYNNADKECLLSKTSLRNPKGGAVVKHPELTYVEKTGVHFSFHLAFRATAGSPAGPTWKQWENTSHHDDIAPFKATVPRGCLTMYAALPCGIHYRSKALDEWTHVEKVQMAFFKYGVKVAYIIFDVTGTTHRNEFINLYRVVDSSYLDLIHYQVSHPFEVGVTGMAFLGRRFYVQRTHGGCPYDTGWMAVHDFRPPDYVALCAWDVYENHPYFLYSLFPHAQSWRAGGGLADVFAIFLKFSQNESPDTNDSGTEWDTNLLI